MVFFFDMCGPRLLLCLNQAVVMSATKCRVGNISHGAMSFNKPETAHPTVVAALAFATRENRP